MQSIGKCTCTITKSHNKKSHDNPPKGKSWLFSVIIYLLLAVIIHGAGALLKVLLLLSFETDT